MPKDKQVTTTTAAAPPENSANSQAMTIGQELAVLQPQIESILPEHVSVERFMRIVTTAVVMNPDLRKPELRRSLLTAATKAATDGLVPDGREGAFVIFGGQVVWMPMVAGVIKKVRNSGELKSISSNVVHAKDEFSYWIDDDGEHILHRPNLLNERGDIIAVYAVAKTHKGGVYTEVMSAGQIDQVRKASKAPNSPAWSQWYGEMGRKAVIRRLAKRLPMSSDLEQVIQRDDEMFDFENKRRAEAASSGMAGLRGALGLKAPEQSNGGETTHFDIESACAALRTTTTLEELADVRSRVFADYEAQGIALPIDVEAVANDHRLALSDEE